MITVLYARFSGMYHMCYIYHLRVKCAVSRVLEEAEYTENRGYGDGNKWFLRYVWKFSMGLYYQILYVIRI